jgi:CheY-specific phosphatase CheX
MLLALGALVFSVWILIETFVYERTVPGYPSIIIGIMVIGGVQLLMIGVMGEYIGKVLAELKHRPAYFVAEHSLKRQGDEAETLSDTAIEARNESDNEAAAAQVATRDAAE